MLFKKSVRGRIVLGRDGVSREMMGRDLYIYCISLPVVLAALWGSGLSSPPAHPCLPFGRWGASLPRSEQEHASTERLNQFLLLKNIDRFNRRSL